MSESCACSNCIRFVSLLILALCDFLRTFPIRFVLINGTEREKGEIEQNTGITAFTYNCNRFFSSLDVVIIMEIVAFHIIERIHTYTIAVIIKDTLTIVRALIHRDNRQRDLFKSNAHRPNS